MERPAAIRGIIALASLMLLVQGPARAFKPDPVDIDERVATVLAKRSDADSLAAAAVLSLQPREPGALTLIAKASDAEPTRPDLLWLYSQICHNTPSCDSEPIEIRLRNADPSNGAGWLGALARASAAGDPRARDAALAAIGQSERVDIYWTQLVYRLTRAAVQTQAITLSGAEVSIIGVLAGRSIPAYHAVLDACKAERLKEPGVMETCREVARAFQNGDTIITAMAGTSLAKRVWPEQSAQWNTASAAARAHENSLKQLSRVNIASPAYAEEFLKLCGEKHREQDVIAAQLEQAQ